MRRVLIISYFMPPATGPGGVNRVCRWLRYLREHGYEPIVLTASLEESARAWAEIWDERPMGCRIERVGQETLRTPRTRLGRLCERLLTLPDLQAPWCKTAIDRAADLIRRERPDVILTTSPPFSVAMLGAKLRRKFDIPWVCDFRDPWTDYFLGIWPSRLHYWICRAMEQRMMAWPDAFIAITPGHQRIIERRWPELRGRVVTITNGFEDEWLAQARQPSSQGPNGNLDIAYSGSFCGPTDPQDCPSLAQRLFSYRPRDFQPEGHTAGYLLEAMASFLRRSPGWRNRLRLTHVGVPDESAMRYATKLGIGEAFHSPGYVSAAESARLQANVSALFLCLAHSPSGDYNDCVPQKTYEYLATGRPILAAVPDGDARDFLLRAGSSLVCHTTDVTALAEGIGQLCEMADGDRPEPAPDWQFIAQFRASNLTCRLATVFRAVLGGTPALDRMEPFPNHVSEEGVQAWSHSSTNRTKN